eukprot:c16288_g1_i1.p1 GENE.c16288_g1_i1~~c16288_g1_i1.p1  ORF type:complete len:660 (+),score=148.04 c16288_g1_i1:20-1999(+)
MATSSSSESAGSYGEGGYLRLHVGDSLSKNRYVIVKKLGWGHFSTVWLAWDSKAEQFVAIKIQKGADKYFESARDEIDILKTVHKFSANRFHNYDPRENDSHTVQLLDNFVHNSRNGSHVCMVFEVLGANVLSLIKHYKHQGIPLHITRNITRDVLRSLHFLHKTCNLIHTDLKPENVVLKRWRAPNLSEAVVTAVKAGQYKLIPSLVTAATAPVNKQTAANGNANGDDATANNSNNNGANADNGLGVDGGPKCARPSDDAQADASDDNSKNPNASTAQQPNNNDYDDFEYNSISNIIRKSKKAPKPKKPFREQTEGWEDSAVVVDLGNACWVNKHFSRTIQTRQYRSPEVMLGGEYNETADIWSLACLVFEMVTGDYLFDPQAGVRYDRDEDHLAQVIELVGPLSHRVFASTPKGRKYFTSHGTMRNIPESNPAPLHVVLQKRYGLSEKDAGSLASFLLPMLDPNPQTRATAAECLNHSWLTGWEESSEDGEATAGAEENDVVEERPTKTKRGRSKDARSSSGSSEVEEGKRRGAKRKRSESTKRRGGKTKGKKGSKGKTSTKDRDKGKKRRSGKRREPSEEMESLSESDSSSEEDEPSERRRHRSESSSTRGESKRRAKGKATKGKLDKQSSKKQKRSPVKKRRERDARRDKKRRRK